MEPEDQQYWDTENRRNRPFDDNAVPRQTPNGTGQPFYPRYQSSLQYHQMPITLPPLTGTNGSATTEVDPRLLDNLSRPDLRGFPEIQYSSNQYNNSEPGNAFLSHHQNSSNGLYRFTPTTMGYSPLNSLNHAPTTLSGYGTIPTTAPISQTIPRIFNSPAEHINPSLTINHPGQHYFVKLSAIPYDQDAARTLCDDQGKLVDEHFEKAPKWISWYYWDRANGVRAMDGPRQLYGNSYNLTTAAATITPSLGYLIPKKYWVIKADPRRISDTSESFVNLNFLKMESSDSGPASPAGTEILHVLETHFKESSSKDTITVNTEHEARIGWKAIFQNIAELHVPTTGNARVPMQLLECRLSIIWAIMGYYYSREEGRQKIPELFRTSQNGVKYSHAAREGHGADGGPQPDSDGTIIVAEVFGNKPGINVPGCGETLQSTSGALY